MFCIKCGNKLNEGDKFCINCGNVVNGNFNQVNNLNMTNNNVGNQDIFKERITKTYQKENLIIIVVVAVLFVLLVVAGSIWLLSKGAAGTIGMDKGNNIDVQESYIKKITLSNMSLEFDKSYWNKVGEINDKNTISYNNDKGVFALMYIKDKVYYNSYTAMNSIKKQLKDEGNTIVDDIESLTINGNEWYKIRVLNGSNYILYLVYADGYDVYFFTFASSIINYYGMLDEVEKVYNTLTYDETEKNNSLNNAKDEFLGEWDFGSAGYVVANQDKIYIYKDASRDPNNVYSGTYTVSNKVATAATGYVDGYDIRVVLEKKCIDGECDYPNNTILQYVLTPNGDGTYFRKSFPSGNTGVARRVK